MTPSELEHQLLASIEVARLRKQIAAFRALIIDLHEQLQDRAEADFDEGKYRPNFEMRLASQIMNVLEGYPS